MIKKILFGLSLFLLTGRLAVFGQRENSNWYFGINAALNFPVTGAPVPVAGSAMDTYEATATVSDASGQLLFYTNSQTIWNRNHQPMPNGTNIGGNQSSSQGALAVQNPANPQQYYVFVMNSAENLLSGGLKYNLVDMTQQSGLGSVVGGPVQISPVQITEKLTAVPHANGRDTWVLVHGWLTNTFYAYLLTPSGLQFTPVVTNIGSVHSGGGGTYGNANSVGYMRASPSGTKLAVGVRDARFEVFDFNPATGQLSNYIQLGPTFRSYGVAFSPDSRLLYGTNLNYLQVYQFDMLAGSPTDIANSGIVVANTLDNVGGLQMGPDGKLYVSVYNSAYLAVISNPNVRGTGCGFQANAVYLNGKMAQIGLPNFPASRTVVPTVAFTSTPGCMGAAVAFAGTTTPTLSGATATWNFGDPASGTANTATGLAPTHLYSAAGTYQVTLTVAHASLTTPITTTQAVTVAPLPRVKLGRDTTLCGNQLLLSAGMQPAGTTYRWQDGSTAATYLVRASGRYRVVVTSAAGCASRDSLQVTLNPLPTPRLPADTAVCAASVLLRPGTLPPGSTYRWQDGSTSATYLAQASGTYSVQVTTPQGCGGRATTRVQLGVAPVVRLGADTLVCPNAVWTLRPNPQPAGTLYRWQDGSTAATYVARGPGQYSVEVRASATGCLATATLRARATDCPVLIPNIITPNGDQHNETFVLKGLTPSDWHLRIFDRWGRQVYDRPRYDNSWKAEGQSEGHYYYLLTHNSSGERYRGWVEVMRSN